MFELYRVRLGLGLGLELVPSRYVPNSLMRVITTFQMMLNPTKVRKFASELYLRDTKSP